MCVYSVHILWQHTHVWTDDGMKNMKTETEQHLGTCSVEWPPSQSGLRRWPLDPASRVRLPFLASCFFCTGHAKKYTHGQCTQPLMWLSVHRGKGRTPWGNVSAGKVPKTEHLGTYCSILELMEYCFRSIVPESFIFMNCTNF